MSSPPSLRTRFCLLFRMRPAKAWCRLDSGGVRGAGLMTQITEDQKYGMIEAISHLIHRDYEAIVEDFVLLDFIPPGVSRGPRTVTPALCCLLAH